MSASRRHTPDQLTARLAQATLRWYPRRWRRRYEDELRAHIEDHGADARDLAGLAWGVLRERWRGPNGPDPVEHPTAAAWWRAGITLGLRGIVAAMLAAGAYQAGRLFNSRVGAMPDIGVRFLLAVVATAGCLAVASMVRMARTKARLPSSRADHFSRQAAWLMLAVYAGGAFISGSVNQPIEPMNLLVFGGLILNSFVEDAIDFRGRHRRFRDAEERYLSLKQHLRHAQAELARLESLPIDLQHPDLISRRNEIGKMQVRLAAAIEVLRDPGRAAPTDM